MDFKTKVFMGLMGMAIFFFAIFYPNIVPSFIASNTNPLIVVIIYESLFFGMIYLVTLFLFGHVHKHSLKIALAIFLLYHVVDAVEPPFVLNVDGTWNTDGTSYITSWDYGISYNLKSMFNITGPSLYYWTNLGFVAIAILLFLWLLKKENLISKYVHEALS